MNMPDTQKNHQLFTTVGLIFLFLITLCWHFTPLVADTGGDERSGTPTAAKNYTFFSFLTPQQQRSYGYTT